MSKSDISSIEMHWCYCFFLKKSVFSSGKFLFTNGQSVNLKQYKDPEKS